MKQACFYSANNLHEKEQFDLPVRQNKNMQISDFCKRYLFQMGKYLILCLIVFFNLINPVALHSQTATPPSNYPGHGTSSSDAYLISSLNNLYWLAVQVNGGTSFSGVFFKQTANIDATSTSTWNSNGSGGFYGWNPIGASLDFSGTYDGQGNTISNLYINNTSLLYTGLFGSLNGATIQNLGVTNITVTGNSSVGGLVGSPYGVSTINNCYTSGTITANTDAGGIVGKDDGSGGDNAISQCHSSCTVSGTKNVGGLIGNSTGTDSRTISSSYATGSVTATGTDASAGGLLGYIDQGTVSNCYATGSVSSSNGICGGIIGTNLSNVNYCFATGAVTGKTYTGGLLGTNSKTVTNSYSIGIVTANNAGGGELGGFVGDNAGTIDKCYTISPISSATIVATKGGFVGRNYGTGGHTNNCFFNSDIYSGIGYGIDPSGPWPIGKTTAQLKTQSTYTALSWDFSTVWGIDAAKNNQYPYLIWQSKFAPTVTTSSISTYNGTSATLGGNVTTDGGATVTERGVVYSSTDNTPTIGETGVTKDINGSGTGTYSKSIGSLTPVTTYYVQAYATNEIGTSYGGVNNFTTLSVPTVTGISPTSGPIGGNTSVTITGTNLTSATAVKFGATSASGFTVNSATQITVTSPAGSAGTVDITVITTGGTSATSGSDQFTYLPNGTFTGATNTDWNTATNWAGGSVPTSSTDVTIPSGKNTVISATTSANCNNLTVTSGGTLTISSSASGTGSLIISGTSTGNVTCQNYITGTKWHIISPNASGGNITTFIQDGSNALPVKNVSGTNNYGMMDYNETTNLWKSYYTAATGAVLTAGQGYCIQRTSNGIVTFTGTLTSGSKTVAITKLGAGWNCIGNPYTSAIKMNNAAGSNNFLATNSSKLDGSYACMYLWDDASSSYKILGNVSYSGRDLGQNNFQSGQGFFVKAQDNTGLTVQFNTNMQVHQPATTFKSGQASWPGLELTATTASQARASTVVAFNDAMTKGLDPTYDAGLLRGSAGISIYTRLVEDNGIDFAIQCLPESGYQNFIIPVGLDYAEGGEVTISVQTAGLPLKMNLILEDRLNKTFTALNQGSEVNVTVDPNTKGIGRFYLHTTALSANDLKTVTLTGKLNAYVSSNNEIRIIGEVSSKAIATLYDAQGKVIWNQNLRESTLNVIPASNIKTGIYMLSVRDTGKLQSFKLFIKQ